jgi:uroporphyrinogen decarboxylase
VAETMTARQRVMAALNHQQPDRVPRDLGGTVSSGISIGACENLYRYLNFKEPVQILHERGKLARLAEPVLEQLQIDMRGVVPGGGTFAVGQQAADGTFTDEWGIVRARAGGDGYYHVVKPPLAGELTQETIRANAARWPDPADPALAVGIREEAQRLHGETACAVILSLPIGIFHQTQFLRGFEDWLMDLALDPRTACYLLDRMVEHWLERARRLIEAAGEAIDIIMYGDDIAHNTGPLVSPAMYRRLLKPYQVKICSALRSWSSAKVLYHTDGDVSLLMDDFIEAGVDALNPIQVTAGGMADIAGLKARYGDRITFWGGVDTQQVLPFWQPAEVRAEVRRLADTLGQGGGYIVSASNDIIADVPPENICAMFAAFDT